MCVFSCLVGVLDCANDFPHVSQVYRFTPCVFSWCVSVPESVKDFPQVSHV